MHLAPLIRDLAVILGVAALVTLLFKQIRQPVVLGYIVAGIIIGPHTPPFPLVTDLPSIRIWAELGVIFLMFSLGLEFSFRKLASVGISSGITALIEIVGMLCIGYFTGRLLGWRWMDSLFLGAILSISSTTIIIRALDELKLKSRRFAEMIFAILIVEDLVAILLLVALSAIASSASLSGIALLTASGKLVLVMTGWFLAGYFLLPRFVRYVGRVGNDEMLTILSIGLCLALVVFSAHFHYSVALGAFIMGSILAESTESHRIEERMAPLRDLFSAIFFVSVGMLIDPSVLVEHWRAVILISLVTIAGKVSTTTLGALVTGQTLRSSVQVGFGLAQIGEFSFIMATLGLTLGATSDFLYPIAVAVSLITTFTTPYMIRYSHSIAVGLEGRLPLGLREAMARYVAWAQERRADTQRRRDFYRRLGRWLLCGILVTIVFTLVSEYARPWVELRTNSAGMTAFLMWTMGIGLSAPFVWAMMMGFRDFTMPEQVGGKSAPAGGTLFMMRLLTVLWIGILGFELFAARHALIVAAMMLTVLFVVFYRQLEQSYHWFERRFLSTFDQTSKSKVRTDPFRGLAPWDAHLVRLKVHPNSDLVLKKLSESALRERHGLNVVVIQRGIKTIVAPRPDEQILPKDELLVLGTDDQIDSARASIEKPPGIEDRYRHLSGYALRSLLAMPGSTIVTRSIREARFREDYGAIVVGLERGGRKHVNPNSNERIEPGDTLWLVGEKEGLERLFAEVAV